MSFIGSIVPFIVASLAASSAWAQTTWYVDASASPPGSGSASNPYASIQYAIDASMTVDGDTLAVAAGTYLEAIDSRGKSIKILGDGASTTTIDATGKNSSVVRFVSGESSTATLGGFRITGGTGSTTSGYGSPAGGGVLCVGSSPTLEDLVIIQNQAGWGGGIQLYAGANATVRDCEVAWNTASPDGGGIYVRDCTSPNFIRVKVHDNQASVWGGGYYLTSQCNAYLERCSVTGNSAGSSGGAFILQSSTSPYLRNCTVADNSSGFFLYHANGGANLPTLINCIVWTNGSYNFLAGSQSGGPTATYSNISSGLPGLGNINANPLFASDYRLQPGSPCIDAGDPTSPPDPDATVADMGAYYFDQNPCQPPVVYCTPKLNSLGCMPSIGALGQSASLGGQDNFFILASNLTNQQLGMLIWSVGENAVPFCGGTLCLMPPIIRTVPLSSGGSSLPSLDCTGAFSYHFSQAYMSQLLLSVGDVLHAQYWMRDSADPFGLNVGLSNGLKFTICP